jgi:hypothetical protein
MAVETPALGAVRANIAFPDVPFTVTSIGVSPMVLTAPVHVIARVNLHDRFVPATNRHCGQIARNKAEVKIKE